MAVREGCPHLPDPTSQVLQTQGRQVCLGELGRECGPGKLRLWFPGAVGHFKFSDPSCHAEVSQEPGRTTAKAGM